MSSPDPAILAVPEAVPPTMTPNDISGQYYDPQVQHMNGQNGEIHANSTTMNGNTQPHIQTIYSMGYSDSNGGYDYMNGSGGANKGGGQRRPASVSQNGSEVESIRSASIGEEYNSEYDYAEPIKLFVGQVPKTMEEADLFPIFEKFGPMDDVAIIRDKHTGQHRGCAFVTYLSKESADACEKELHNTHVFEGGKRPVQVRPAGKKEENKVFVGMLPRAVTEEVVTQVFQVYGEISGVFVIRSTDGYRKGCAFVKYTNRQAAFAAIEDLNGKVAFQGSDRPLIVKIADTKGEKKVRLNKNLQYGSDADSVSMTGQSAPGYINYPHYQTSPMPMPMYPGAGIPPIDLSAAPGTSPYGMPHPHAGGSPIPEYMYPQPYGMTEQIPPVVPSYPTARPPRQPQNNNSGARPREGPAGANLFIYHLPHDLTDADLATAFNPFGNVISAKVYVDKYTGESKGFGFVSYDSIISAEQAIDLMNGFQIGNKRLKVQHKRVHHRAPTLPPTMNNAMNNAIPPNMPPYYHHPGQQMMTHPPMAYHDVPVPSIEISSENAAGLHNTLNSNGHVNVGVGVGVGPNDMDALAQSFNGLHADERTGSA